MSRHRRWIILGVALTAFAVGATASQAACRMQVGEARCVTAGSGFGAADDRDMAGVGSLSGHFRKAQGVKTIPDVPVLSPGDRLPDGVTVLFNRSRYHLPAPRDGWTYFRVGYEIYRADMFTRTVIDRVNDHMPVRY